MPDILKTMCKDNNPNECYTYIDHNQISNELFDSKNYNDTPEKFRTNDFEPDTINYLNAYFVVKYLKSDVKSDSIPKYIIYKYDKSSNKAYLMNNDNGIISPSEFVDFKPDKLTGYISLMYDTTVTNNDIFPIVHISLIKKSKSVFEKDYRADLHHIFIFKNFEKFSSRDKNFSNFYDSMVYKTLAEGRFTTLENYNFYTLDGSTPDDVKNISWFRNDFLLYKIQDLKKISTNLVENQNKQSGEKQNNQSGGKRRRKNKTNKKNKRRRNKTNKRR